MAISLWDDLITPQVSHVDGNGSNIHYANTTTGLTYAQAYYPGGDGGSAWFNPNYNSGPNDIVHPTIGQYGFMTLIHETGHTFGLSHPGPYNGGYPTYEADAQYAQDSRMYTVMSYFDATNTGGTNVASDGQTYYPQTPMLHDVLAIQSIYGADATTRVANTTYGFHSTAGREVFDFTQNHHPILTIYDAGGDDTIDLSGFYAPAVLNLISGTFSNVDGMTRNLAITPNTTIENGIGGEGSDMIAGNASDNVLDGRGGNDTLLGGRGSNVLIGGGGDDVFEVRSPTDHVIEHQGEGRDLMRTLTGYTLPDNVDDLVLLGNSSFKGAGNALANSIKGNEGANNLFGYDGNDTLTGGAGPDTLVGGTGIDTFLMIKADAKGDRIADFSGAGVSGGDRLVLKGYAADASLAYHADTAKWSVNEHGSALDIFTIAGVTKLAAGDFYFVA